jgi:hypothetical protein
MTTNTWQTICAIALIILFLAGAAHVVNAVLVALGKPSTPFAAVARQIEGAAR